jgi:peptidoglycan/xylan/chitin deacetylase (PgdA/CDA1 family)
MRGLLEEGFAIWRLRDALNHSREGLSFPPRSAVITFDDGYHNVYRNAWPILKSLNIPATIFIVTGHIGRKEPFPFDSWANLHHDAAASEVWSPLRWEECSEMEDSGLVDIGSHSHSHADFRRNPDDFADDLRKSLAMLDQRLAPLDRPFAFPFGSISRGFASPLLQARARDVGVTCALTTEIGLVSPGMSPYAWPRLEVDSSDISASIRAKVDGWYSWMNGARHAFWRGRKVLRSLSETVPSRAARG